MSEQDLPATGIVGVSLVRMAQDFAPLLVGYTGRLLSAEDGKTVVGVKEVGKDTVASFLAAHAERLGFEVIHLSFADALKNLVAKVYGLSRDRYDQPGQKEVPIPEYPGYTYRLFLTKVGTDVARHLNPPIWIKLLQDRLSNEVSCPWNILDVREDRLQARLQDVGLPEPLPRRKLIQITDVRFKNEYDMLKEWGVKIVQVTRQSTVHHHVDTHASNGFDPTMVPDLVMYNDGTLEDLRVQVPELWTQLQ